MPSHSRSQIILALADGRLPDGVDPDSQDGQRYRAIIADLKANRPPKPTPAQLAVIVPILRGAQKSSGGEQRAS